jgi:hypothetical protein
MLVETRSKVRRRMMPRKTTKKEQMPMKYGGALMIWADTFCFLLG